MRATELLRFTRRVPFRDAWPSDRSVMAEPVDDADHPVAGSVYEEPIRPVIDHADEAAMPSQR